MKKSITMIFFAGLFAMTAALLSHCTGSDSSRQSASATDSLSKKLERGRYLAHHVSVCIDCHSKRDFSKLSGPVIAGTEGMGGEPFDAKFGIPGVVYARNITSDTVTGIGKWSDAEIARAITQGINKNGDTLFPLMPYPHYNGLAKDDVDAIVAYIRTLPPIRNEVPKRQLAIPISAAYPPFLKPSVDSNIRPEYSDMVKYGGYVVNSAGCFDCHTPTQKGQFQMDKMFAGGTLFDVGPFKVQTANLTPDTATGIGGWSENLFLQKFQRFRDAANYNFDPGKSNSIMPWTLYGTMDDFDIKAIYAYLRTVKPVKNQVVKFPQ